MGQHDAAFNPVTFAVGYKYSAGTNAELTRAIDECMLTKLRLGDETVTRFFRHHVNEVDEVARQRAAGEFQRVMLSAAESAARTGDRPGAFGDQLSGLTLALRANASSSLGLAIHEAIVGTAEMRDVASALLRQVVARGQEIERLRDDLSRGRDEVLIVPLPRVLNRRTGCQGLLLGVLVPKDESSRRSRLRNGALLRQTQNPASLVQQTTSCVRKCEGPQLAESGSPVERS